MDPRLHPDVFYSYTRALRHPVLIGRVAGWPLPWTVSATQLGAVAATGFVLLVGRAWWAHLGGVGNLTVFIVVLVAAGWAARAWRVEGRSPAAAAAGYLSVVLSGRSGVCNGRAVRQPRRRRAGGSAPVEERVTGGRMRGGRGG